MTPTLRRVLWPGVMTAAMLIVLLGLGAWQLRRLAWKQDILDRAAAAEARGPIPLPDNPTPFAKVVVSGKFRHDLTAQFGAITLDTPTGARIGAHLIVPLERENASTVLIDRGWAPFERATGIDQPEGIVDVVGFVHPVDKAGLFSAADDPPRRLFYTLDAEAIAAALGLRSVAPTIVVAVGPPPAARWPEPAKQLPRPPNNHLTYAITWFGLAIALLVVFVVWARKGKHA